MIFSDSSIQFWAKNYQLIDPFNLEQLQPASYDLQLGELRSLNRLAQTIYVDHHNTYDLQPKEFIIASTIEKVRIPNDLVGRLEGKSSWARKGLIIHTAGFIDPGFIGQLTLEITNLSDEPIFLEKGMLICQIAFQKLDKPAMRPYGHPELNSHYQNQSGVQPSWIT